MNLKLRYKELFNAHVFLDFVLLAFFVKHDSHQVFLAIATVMFAYWIACFFTRSKLLMIVSFLVISVTVCQLSVTAKRLQMDVEFRQQQTGQNATGVLVADVVHGFKKIGTCPGRIKNAFLEAKSSDKYSLLENINPRYATMVVLIPIGVVSLIRKKVPKMPKPSKEIEVKK